MFHPGATVVVLLSVVACLVEALPIGVDVGVEARTGPDPNSEAEFTAPVIEFAALKKGLEDKSLTVIDVRTRAGVARNGQVPGSYNIPFVEIEKAFTDLSEEEFKTKYGFDRPAAPGDNVVVMCHGGGTAKRAIQILQKYGYKNLIWYEGSFVDWLANQGPVINVEGKESIAAKPINKLPPNFLPDSALGGVKQIDFDEVKAGVSAGKFVLVDVRPAEMVQENGRIPGSNNIPLNEVEEAFGKLTADEFKAKYGFDRPEKPGTNVLIYCQIGQTAREAVVILQKLGYSDLTLYPGSFADWKAKGGEIELVPTSKVDSAAADDQPDITSEVKSEGKEHGGDILRPEIPSPSKDVEKTVADEDGADARRDNKYVVKTKPADISDLLPKDAGSSAAEPAKKKLLDLFSVKIVTFDELKRLYDEPRSKIVIIDASPKEEFAKKHITGSFNVPADEVKTAHELSKLDFKAKYGFSKPESPGRNIVVTSRNGCSALSAIRRVVSKGGTEVMWYAGGVDDWISNGGSTDDGEVAAAAA